MTSIVITGATGFIGKALTAKLLDRGYAVTCFTRSKRSDPSNGQALRYSTWNVESGQLDKESLCSADHVIHLAGAGIGDRRWTRKRKAEIYSSRIESSRLLVKTLIENENKVRTFISASAIGWYGEDPVIPNPHPFVETDPPSTGFLADTCKDWERSLAPLEDKLRLVIFRQGIVLGKGGGAMVQFEKVLRWRVAAIPGSGKQRMSWVSLNDLVSMYIAAIEMQNIRGVYNAVAPEPVPTETLVKTMAVYSKKHALAINIPAWALRLALGEMSSELLKSTTVSAGKIADSGFLFKDRDIRTFFGNLH